MSAPTAHHRKRPPPIAIPPLPPSRLVSGPNASANAPPRARGTGEHSQRFTSSSTQQAMRSRTTTPLTSPLEPDESRLAVPGSGSQASKHRASAMTTLSNLMDQARGSPHKSECGSVPSRRGSTVRSRQSERSHRSATTAQAQLEALGEDESTTRSLIESRSERQLFKMAGQIPPTPTTGAIDPEQVYIRTEDLRAQCRAASEEKKREADEPSRSPKKKLFGVSLPMFSRAPTTIVAPAMPSKAAQILGTTPSRKPRRVEPRPIKPARVAKTPTKVTRSDTARSLTAKVYDQNSFSRAYQSSFTRGNPTSGRRTPGKENMQPLGQTTANPSNESVAPPTPPAKDTPPNFRPVTSPTSPLRRAPSHQDLRDSYAGPIEKGMQLQLQFPTFVLSPSPPKTAIHGNTSASPTKFRPYTAEDYTKLIEGEALQWPYPEQEDEAGHGEGSQSAPLCTDDRDVLQVPHVDRWSEDNHYNERLGQRLSPLPPRFYSPSDRSVRLFKEGESPSQNTDANRMLFTPPKPSLLQIREDSNNASIEMVFQGSVNDIESDSSTTQTTNSGTQHTQPLQQRNEADLATRVMQELHIGEKHQSSPVKNGPSGHLQPDVSSSKLTDMLNSASPHADFNGDFRNHCPSAVPSPLNKFPGPHAPMRPLLRGGGDMIVPPWTSPRTPKTIDDHFYMTNEHLDVVGKTTYDALDMFSKQQISATNAKHEQVMAAVGKHVEDLKAQISSVSEKADHSSNQTHNIGLKLEQIETFSTDKVFTAIAEQAKKTTEMEVNLREIQKAVVHLQQTVDKLSSAQQPLATPLPTPSVSQSPYPAATHHPQPSVVGYYGNGSETIRDDQPPMPPLQDRNASNNYESHNDTRGNYGGNWQSPAWNGRSTHHGRSKEDRPSYSGTNPYHFANGGQYNNGYMNGYSSYNFSASPSDQPFAYGYKPAQQ